MPSIDYKQNFDLNDGDLVGQDNWYQGFAGVSVQVQSGVVYQSAKAVEGHYVAAAPSADRDFAGVNNEEHWIKFAARTSNQAEDYPYINIGKDSANISILFFGLGGYWQAYNGNGAGGGAWLSTGVALVSGRWDLVKFKQNPITKKWDCYIIDMAIPKLTDLGFRNNTADSLNWFRMRLAASGNAAAKYLDELEIRPYDMDAEPWEGTDIGFNSGEGYTIGDLAGQNGWTGTTEWKVNNVAVYEGDQSARAKKVGVVFATKVNLQSGKKDDGDYFVEAVLRCPDITFLNLSPGFFTGYNLANIASGIAIFNNSVWAFDGSISNWVDTGYTPINGEWVRCKVFLRYTGGVSTYDVYVNDMVTPKLTGLQFEDTVGSGNLYLDNLSITVTDPAAEAYIDDIKIYKPAVGGVNLLSNRLENNPLMGGGLLH